MNGNASNSASLLVGFGEADLTPEPPADSQDVFRVLDPLAFRAVAIRQGDSHAVLLTGDFFSFERDLVQRAANHLRTIAWLKCESILPAVSHCGGAPILAPSYVTQPCPQLRVFGQEEKYAELAARAIENAIKNLKPARLGFSSAPAPGFSYNRRSFGGDGKLVMSNFMLPFPRGGLRYQDVDDNVYVMRVDDAAGEATFNGARPLGAAMIFGCHALSRRDCYGHVWADYPATACQIVEQSLGVSTVFMQGALGDVVPISRGGNTHERIGRGVGGAALSAFERIPAATGTTLSIRRTSLRVPMFDDAYVGKRLTQTENAEEATAGDVRFWEYTRQRIRRGETEFEYTMTLLDFGDSALLHMPGEVFVQTSKAIRDESPFEQTIIVSGPTADVGYLCPAEAHRQGGMEPAYAALAGEAEGMIRAAAIELLKASRSKLAGVRAV